MSESTFHDRLDVKTTLATSGVLTLFRRSLNYLKPQKYLLASRVGLIFVIFGLGLFVPWLLKIVLDHGVMQQPITLGAEGLLYPVFIVPYLDQLVGMEPLSVTLYALVTLSFMFLFVGYSGNTLLEANLAEGADVATRSENKISAGFSSAHGLVGLLDLCIAIRMSQRITDHVRGDTFNNLSRQSMTSLNLQRTGDAMFRVLHDAPSLAGICHALILNPLAMVVSVAANLWVLAAVYGNVAPSLVWIGFSAVGLTLIVTSPLARWARRISQSSRASGSATTDEVEEGLKNVAVVQSLGGTEKQQNQFAAASRESFRQSLLLVWVLHVVEWLAENVHLVFATAGFWVIFSGIVRGDLTLGDAPVVIRMYSLLYETAMQFGRIWIDQQDNAVAARRVFFAMDHDLAREQDATTLIRLPQLDDSFTLQFDHVGYHYPDGRQALESVSFEVSAGETIAIVGPSGAGKTTLAYMIPKFLAPTAGRVLVAGRDLAEINTTSVRENVAYVFQEHQLLTDTVAANLRLAKPDADEAELSEVCRLVGALDFVTEMPDGLHARIGRGGGTLSVGQKQRLSIARGLLHNASILILDEPTAALDPQSEHILLDTLGGSSTRLTIVIAHRLTTIRGADKVLFMDQGRLIEVGAPDALLEREDSHFRQFVNLARLNES